MDVKSTKEGPEGEPRKRYGLWTVVIVGVLSAAASMVVTGVTVVRCKSAGLSCFFEHLIAYAKSPGFGGFAAIVAAFIAFRGISRQVTVAMHGVEHQRKAMEQQREALDLQHEEFKNQKEAVAKQQWWDRFEWVAGRAIPSNEGESALPYNVVLHILKALAGATDDDNDKEAVEEIRTIASESAEVSTPLPEQDPVAIERRVGALSAYAEATRGSSAESPGVSQNLYELEVFQALTRALPPGSIRTGTQLPLRSGALFIPELFITYQGRKVAVEVGHARLSASPRFRRLVETDEIVDGSGVEGVIFIVPEPLTHDSLPGPNNVVLVVWNPGTDDRVFLEGLESVLKGSTEATSAT